MTKYGFHANNLDINRLNAKRITVEDKVPVEYVISPTIAYSTANILAAKNWSAATAAVTNTTILMQPPYPTQLLVIARAAGTAAHGDAITFVGMNAWGSTISDSVYVSGTAAGVFYTSNAYAKITSIYPTGKKVIKSSAICIGTRTSVIGVPYPIASSADIISYSKGGTYATSTPVSLTSTTYRTLTVATTAAKTIKIVYKSQIQKDWKRQ